MSALHNRRSVSPDFIGIGLRRCATTWLHRVLDEHPQISKPPSGLHFFNRNYQKGVEWYRDQLAFHLQDDRAAGIVGEFSTTYTFTDPPDLIAQRIFRDFPHVKLIASIRNPVDRCYSDYLRDLRFGEIPDIAFEKAIEEFPQLVERGRYVSVFEAFLNYFPRERLHIIRYDDIVHDPASVVGSLYEYLGVDPEFEPTVLDRVVGDSYTPKSAGFEQLIRNLQRYGGRVGRRLRLGGFVELVKNLGFVEKARELNTDTEHRDEQEERLRALTPVFRDDILQTMELTGLDLSHWLKEADGPDGHPPGGAVLQ